MTSFVEKLGDILAPHVKASLQPIIAFIFDKDARVSMPALEIAAEYGRNDGNAVSILHFLVNTGYLTYEADPTSNAKSGYVWIPNELLLQGQPRNHEQNYYVDRG